MRVGLVCPYSFDAHGGVQNHVLDLARALDGLGHEVRVLAPGEQDASLPPYVTTTGRTLPMPYNGSVARVAFGPLVAGRVRRWLAEADVDVLHLHEPASPSLSVLALWAARTPVVATFHTAQERSRTLETSAATVLRAGLGKIDAHVAVSEDARRTMARYVDAEADLIPNGVDVRRFAEATARPSPGPGPRIAFVGRLDEPRKGFAVLRSALPVILRAHPAATFLVVGEGSRREALAGLDPRTAARVRLVGAVPDHEKARVLASAGVLVAPNTHGESFGIVLVEAMAAGVPVVASDLPAFRRVLSDGRLGRVFRAGDPASLAGAVLDVLCDADLAVTVHRARAAAAAYDWSVVAPQVVAVYRRVLAAEGAVAVG